MTNAVRKRNFGLPMSSDATHTWKPGCSNFKVSGFLKNNLG
jgi:hypothetical protein